MVFGAGFGPHGPDIKGVLVRQGSGIGSAARIQRRVTCRMFEVHRKEPSLPHVVLQEVPSGLRGLSLPLFDLWVLGLCRGCIAYSEVQRL